jgi:GNAT superfamily N-acetyltransferase
LAEPVEQVLHTAAESDIRSHSERVGVGPRGVIIATHRFGPSTLARPGPSPDSEGMPPVAANPPDVVVRSAGPHDVPAIADFYRLLSPTSFSERFMSRRSEAVIVALAALEARRGDVAVVAVLPDDNSNVVGEARYVPTGSHCAEFALAVLDDVQGHGVGGRLLDALLAEAAARGLDRLAAAVAGGNDRMLRLARRLGWVLVEPLDDDVGVIEIATAGGMPGWPAGGRRRVLVESPTWRDTPEVVMLRAAGVAVRRCPGPRPGTPGCPLVVDSACRLAEGADEIVDLLPDDVPACAAVRAEHTRRWPSRLRPTVAGTPSTAIPASE